MTTLEHASFTNRADTVRQWVVTVCAVVAIAGSFVGSGALGGTPIAEAAGGALSSDSTLIAPAVPAFSIWSVIYLGLVAYTVWQLLPSRRHDVRQRSLGYPVAASLVLNAVWILSVQAGLLAVSVIVIVLLLAVLAYTFRLCIATRRSSTIEAIVVDGTVGLYLGWVCVATAANITAALKAAGFTGWGISPDVWAMAIIAVAALVGVGLAIAGRGRLSAAASLCWGLVWVSVARLTGSPHSVPTAIAAFAAVAVVLIVTVAYRVRAASMVNA
jgi:hypothetical protein